MFKNGYFRHVTESKWNLKPFFQANTQAKNVLIESGPCSGGVVIVVVVAGGAAVSAGRPARRQGPSREFAEEEERREREGRKEEEGKEGTRKKEVRKCKDEERSVVAHMILDRAVSDPQNQDPCTGPPDRMSHRKWRETKQQLT